MAEQTLEIWSDGKHHWGRLVCPYGLDPNGNPANVEFTAQLPVSVDPDEAEKALTEHLVGRAQAHAQEHARYKESRSEKPPERKQQSLELEVAALANVPLPQDDVGPDRDEKGRAISR